MVLNDMLSARRLQPLDTLSWQIVESNDLANLSKLPVKEVMHQSFIWLNMITIIIRDTCQLALVLV